LWIGVGPVVRLTSNRRQGNDVSTSLEQRVQALEDRNAIADLQARYVNFNDGGWNGPTHRFPEAVAELFTPDGVWIGPMNAVRAEGAAAIRELFTQFQVIPFIVHFVTNPLIVIDGDHARGEWHAIVTTTTPDRQALLTLGKYVNEYVRTSTGWKYIRMEFEAAAVSTFEKGWAVEQFIGQDSSIEQFDTRYEQEAGDGPAATK
jgi:SnoaL-like domain